MMAQKSLHKIIIVYIMSLKQTRAPFSLFPQLSKQSLSSQANAQPRKEQAFIL